MTLSSDDAGPDRPDSDDSQEHRFQLLVESVVDYAIFMLDPDGTVLTWNIGAERLKGYTAAEIIGRRFDVFYPPEAIAAGWPRHELDVAAETGRYEEEGWRVRKDGSTFWASVVITALRGPDGRLEGYAKVTRDLTEKRLREEALRQSEEQFRLLLESVKDYAIFLLDTEGTILTWNSGAEAIKGYAASEVLGRNFRMFFTAQDLVEGKPQAELEVARTLGRAESAGWRVRKDGSVFWANAVLTPVHDGDGRLRGFAKVTRDLSAQRRLHEVEQAGRRMQEFIAMLAHELRNPLAPIRNAVSLMQENGLTEASRQHATSVIDRQLGHLTHLVDDLLDVGRIATGKIWLRDELIDYRQVVLLSLESARDAIDRRGHELHRRAAGAGDCAARRRHPVDPGAAQPPDQRRQVHAGERPHRPEGRRRRRDRRHLGDRQRARRRARSAGTDLRSLHPGAPDDRHGGSGPGHRPRPGPGAGRAARRPAHGREPRRRPRQHLPDPPADRRSGIGTCGPGGWNAGGASGEGRA